MVRRRNRAKLIDSIPEGWTPHDGSGCPIDADSMPGLLFRTGATWPVGNRTAGSWNNHWVWRADRPGIVDIVAYRMQEPVTKAPHWYRVWCGQKVCSDWLPTRDDAWRFALQHGLAYPGIDGAAAGLGPLTRIEQGQPDDAGPADRAGK